MNFQSMGATGLTDGTETTLASPVPAPTVTNTVPYTVQLAGKLKITTTQAAPTEADSVGSIGVVQFGNNTTSIGKVTIAAVKCPFKLTAVHAPSSTGDATRKLRIDVAGNSVYYEGDGTLQTAVVEPACSGTADVELYGYDGTQGKGVRIFDLTIEQ